jgi:RND family efflux transporter MFP subunit
MAWMPNRIMWYAGATTMKHLAFTSVLTVALALLCACSRPASREAEIESPVPVIAEPVRLGDIRTTISATGVVTILAGAEFSVFAPQPARIAEITKNVGEAVKSGEVIVRFEFPSLRAQTAVNAAAVKAADLRLQQAKLAQTRIRSLLSSGAASQREMDDADREATLAEGELAVAKAAMNAAEAVGQNASMRAPFDGTVTERLHTSGDLVRADPDDPILRLIDPKQVQVTATLPAGDLSRFVVGATARAVAEAARTHELLRVVSRPQPEAGATSATVTFAFDSPTELAPGTQVGVEIDAEQRINVPLIPATALLKDDSQNPVVVVAAGSIAQRRPVVTGVMDGQQIEIRSGLKAGELIITQGHSSLRDGTPISVTSP